MSQKFNNGDGVISLRGKWVMGTHTLAAARLLQRLGANVIEAAAIIDLPDLGGSHAVEAAGLAVFSVCRFADSDR